MSTGRIGNPLGPQTASTTANQGAENIGSTTSSNASTSTPPKTEGHPQSDSKTTAALKHRGSEVKSQQNINARLLKQDLEKQLGNVPGKSITLEKDAGNDKLAKIHVRREVHTTQPKQNYVKERIGNERNPILLPVKNVDSATETASTKFPNGVGFKTESYIDGDGKRGVTSISIDPPPGGKVVQTSDGGSVIYDKEGKKVGELQVELGGEGMEPTFTLVIHSKEGEYKQTEDGRITFTPKNAR